MRPSLQTVCVNPVYAQPRRQAVFKRPTVQEIVSRKLATDRTEPARQQQLQRIGRSRRKAESYRKKSLQFLDAQSKQIVARNTVIWVSPFEKSKSKIPSLQLKQSNRQGDAPPASERTEPGQLKCINLHRLFGGKGNQLYFRLPPEHLPKAAPSEDPKNLHFIIAQFNRLLELGRPKVKRLGVKGHEVQMGDMRLQNLTRLRSFSLPKSEGRQTQVEWLDPLVLRESCPFFKQYLKGDDPLYYRFVQGICQQGEFDLPAFFRYYRIFVLRERDPKLVCQFITFFFIPRQYQRIELQTLRIMVALLTEGRAEGEQLADQVASTLIAPFASKLEALGFITREVMSFILLQNEELAFLMQALFYKKQP